MRTQTGWTDQGERERERERDIASNEKRRSQREREVAQARHGAPRGDVSIIP